MALVLCTFIVLSMTPLIIAAAGETTWTSSISTTFKSHSTISTTDLSRMTSSPAVTTESDVRLYNNVATESLLGKSPKVQPTQTPDNDLTTLAFGVMSFILILIVVMVILVTIINCRGHCNNTKEEGVKSYSSLVSESHLTSNSETDSITLVSVRTINTDTE